MSSLFMHIILRCEPEKPLCFQITNCFYLNSHNVSQIHKPTHIQPDCVLFKASVFALRPRVLPLGYTCKSEICALRWHFFTFQIQQP